MMLTIAGVVSVLIALAVHESRMEELRKSAEFFRRLDRVAMKRILENRRDVNVYYNGEVESQERF